MPGEMVLRIWDVEHGACAMVTHRQNGALGKLAMVDSGHCADWRPSTHIRQFLRRGRLDYLFITNADQDHLSDLNGLWSEGIGVTTLYRNPHPAPADLRRIKVQGGPLTDDIERFLNIHETFIHPIPEPFDTHMGGIIYRSYFNSYPAFEDTNNLSLAVFFEFGGFKILFPGDLERAGWLALLNRPDFLADLDGINVLVAAHHGRESGYCAEIFDYCRPQVVVMSDKAIQHDTQGMTHTYRQHVIRYHPNGVIVRTTNRRRRVLTTRRDGHIEFTVTDGGGFHIDTEYAG